MGQAASGGHVTGSWELTVTAQDTIWAFPSEADRLQPDLQGFQIDADSASI
jgi:hypothetical protein